MSGELLPQPDDQAAVEIFQSAPPSGSFLDRFRGNTVATAMTITSLVAAGFTAIAAARAKADVDPKTGQQYDPVVLAEQCVQDVGDGFSDASTGQLGLQDPSGHEQHIRGHRSITIQALVRPMQSRLSNDGIPCPAPAGETIKLRLLEQQAKIVGHGSHRRAKVRFVPFSPYVTAINDSTEGTPPDANGNNPGYEPLTFNLNGTGYHCFPRVVDSLLRKQALKENPSDRHPRVGREVALQISTTAHSGAAKEHATYTDKTFFPQYLKDAPC